MEAQELVKNYRCLSFQKYPEMFFLIGWNCLVVETYDGFLKEGLRSSSWDDLSILENILILNLYN